MSVLKNYVLSLSRPFFCVAGALALSAYVASATAAGAVPLLPADLAVLVSATLQNNPVIKSAQARRRAAEQDIEVAARAKWPTVSVTSETQIGGTSTGTDVTALHIDQTLWDNGARDERIASVTTGAEVSALQVRLEQQDLAIQTINAWQALLSAQRRHNAARATVAIIQGFKSQMTRRVRAQASPAIDLELVEARLLQTQVERLSAENGVQLALQNLMRLTGRTDLKAQPWAPSTQVATPLSQLGIAEFQAQIANAPWTTIAQGHPLVQKARLEYAQVGAQLRAKQADRWPQAYARIEQPFSNNAFTGSNQASIVVGFRYTPGAGFSTELEADALATRLEAQSFEVDTATRTVMQLIFDDQQTFAVSVAHANAQALSLAGSQRVLASYERQFQAGRKTWQDLLNAAREVAQNEFSLTDAQSTIQGAMYRLQVRLGAVSALTTH